MFLGCKPLSSIPFESDSHLESSEKSKFYMNELKLIVIPLSVEVLCESYF
jgi:hypothetical protein